MITCSLRLNLFETTRARTARSALLTMVLLLLMACSDDLLHLDAAAPADTVVASPASSLNGQAGGFGLASVSAGGEHACGVTTDGAAYCWGLGADGWLGTATSFAGRGRLIGIPPLRTPCTYHAYPLMKGSCA